MVCGVLNDLTVENHFFFQQKTLSLVFKVTIYSEIDIGCHDHKCTMFENVNQVQISIDRH